MPPAILRRPSGPRRANETLQTCDPSPPVRDCYRAGDLPGVPPVTSNEPIGAGSSVATENDPIKLSAAAVFAYIANLPAYVYHSLVSHTGVIAHGGPPQTVWLCRHE